MSDRMSEPPVGEATSGYRQDQRMPARRRKTIVLLVGLAISALVIVSWTQPWFTVRLVADELDGLAIDVGGEIAAGGLAGLGLAGLALIGALSIAGRVLRVVLGVLQVLIGAVTTLSAVVALADPAEAVAAQVTEVTGVGGDDAVVDLIASTVAGFWPYAATVLGIAAMVLGIVILVESRRWPDSRRHETARFAPEDDLAETPDDLPASSARDTDAVAEWDALSDGADPTSR